MVTVGTKSPTEPGQVPAGTVEISRICFYVKAALESLVVLIDGAQTVHTFWAVSRLQLINAAATDGRMD